MMVARKEQLDYPNKSGNDHSVEFLVFGYSITPILHRFHEMKGINCE